MKKILLGFLPALLIVAGLGSVSAGADSHFDHGHDKDKNKHSEQTVVKGVVTQNGTPVSGAKVTVVCKGKILMDTTNSKGAYSVTFAQKNCPDNFNVIVSASKGGHSGTAMGKVKEHGCKVDLAVINVSIPEYGLIGVLGAGTTGLGLIAFARRRQSQQS